MIIPVALIGLVVSLVVTILFTRQHTRGSFNPGFMVPFFTIPLVAYIVAYFTLRRKLGELIALPSPTVTSGGAIALGAPQGFAVDRAQNAATIEPSAQDQALQRTSRPREVRMSKWGIFNIAIVALVEVIFGTVFGVHLYGLCAQAASFTAFRPADWAIVVLSTLVVWIPFGMWYSQRKECDLLENGEIALAKVVKQWNRNKNNSTIEYMFKDSRGQMQQMLGSDYTGKLSEGMTVAVFYDSENPKRQIPYCGSYHEVVP